MKDIVMRLREMEANTCDEAADIIEFMFAQMQQHSLKMDSQHSYRFRNGWPMTHAIGSSPEDAIIAAIQEVHRSREESYDADSPI